MFRNKSTFSIVHLGRNPFTCSRERGGLNYFKFGTFIGRFLSDGAASTAVKGLILKTNVMHGTPIQGRTVRTEHWSQRATFAERLGGSKEDLLQTTSFISTIKLNI